MADTELVIGARDELGEAIESASRKFEKLERIARTSGGKLQVENKKLVETLLGVGKAADQLDKTLDRTGRTSEQLHIRSEAAARRHSGAMAGLQDELAGVAARYASVAAVAETVRRAFMAHAEVEIVQRKIGLRLGQNTEQMKQLGAEMDRLRQVGNQSQGEMLQAFEKLQNTTGMTVDRIKEVMPTITALANVTGESVETVSGVVGHVARNFGLSAESTKLFADALAKSELSENGVKLKDLGSNAARLAEEFKRAGMTGQEGSLRMIATLEAAKKVFGDSTSAASALMMTIERINDPVIGKMFKYTADGWKQRLEEVKASGQDLLTFFAKEFSAQTEITKTDLENAFGYRTRQMFEAILQGAGDINHRVRELNGALGTAEDAMRATFSGTSVEALNQALAEMKNLLVEVGGLLVNLGANEAIKELRLIFHELNEDIKGFSQFVQNITSGNFKGAYKQFMNSKTIWGKQPGSPDEAPEARMNKIFPGVTGKWTQEKSTTGLMQNFDKWEQRSQDRAKRLEMETEAKSREEVKAKENLRKMNYQLEQAVENFRKANYFGGGGGGARLWNAAYSGGSGDGGSSGGGYRGYRPSIEGQMPTRSSPRSYAPTGPMAPGYQAPHDRFTPSGPGGPLPGQLWRTPQQIRDGVIGPNGALISTSSGNQYATSSGDFITSADPGNGGNIGQLARAIARQEGYYAKGSRAARNFNPGNLEYGPFAISQGATGTDGRHAIFENEEAGFAAMQNLLSQKYAGMTLRQAWHKYAPLKDSPLNKSWGPSVSKFSGIGLDEKISAGNSGRDMASITTLKTQRSGASPEALAFAGPTGMPQTGIGGEVDNALKLLGAHEDQDRAVLKEYMRTGGRSLSGEQNAWCARFVNSVVERAGGTGTDSWAAKSFLGWGRSVGAEEGVLKGDVLVKNRGSDPSKGHVGIATGVSRQGPGGTEYEMLQGNQSDRVATTWERRGRGGVVSVRRGEFPSAANITTAQTRPAGGGAVAGPGARGPSTDSSLFSPHRAPGPPVAKPGASLSVRAHRGAAPSAPAPKPVPATPIAPAQPTPKPATKINDALFFPGGGKAPVIPHPQDHAMFTRKNPMLDRGPPVGDYGGSHIQRPLQGFNRYSDRLRVLRESRNARIGSFSDIGLG